MKNNVKKLAILFMLLSIGSFATTLEQDLNENLNYNAIFNQQQDITATYNGYTENEGYKFISEEGNEIVFQSASSSILEAFDLRSDLLAGKKFIVRYTSSEDEKGIVFTIIELLEVDEPKT
ncbi:hypothetical protein C7447_103306 [Tenacibaculum adriaticum]|uniref:Uncharacterized protein n=1 Tax=Tenacibaculum adriaticum TaxID=413713 RepID=A0A5S5DT03_9FLAO|nr:hypothetical protein [Tenacibaculum adriaticum]TYP98136.1 hypothetical protein C7447_103306 [Tenacibaculum adriaticum]